MKVLIIGGAIEQWMSLEIIFRNFLDEKVRCEIYPIQNEFQNFYYKSIFNKIRFKLGLSTIYSKLNKKLIVFVKNYKPTVIWVFKGMEIYPKTLSAFKDLGIILCNFNPDHPFIYSGSGSGNTNIKNGFPYFDIHFIYGLQLYKECKEKFSNHFVHFPFAYYLEHLNVNEILHQEEVFNHVCFIGNPDNRRADFIIKLNKLGVKIDVYGNNWKDFLSENLLLRVNQPVYGEALWKTFRKYRVQLNLLRKHNLNSHNQRTFELAGCGSIQVAPSTDDHQFFFKNNKNIFLFNDIYECKKQIDFLCSLTKNEAEKIREDVKIHCDSEGNAYKDRSNLFLNSLKEIYG